MYKIGKVLTFAALALIISGCDGSEDKKQPESRLIAAADVEPDYSSTATQLREKLEEANTDEAHISKAYCVIEAKSGSDVVGAVTFSEVEGGVRIIADIGGLTPGKHGFHVHEHGDCSAMDGTSAGGHFNPTNKKHGGPEDADRHVGDLGNLEANDAGFAHYDRVDKVIELNGENSILGKSIVIHAGEDDLTSQPSGDAGARIGCGKIMASEI